MSKHDKPAPARNHPELAAELRRALSKSKKSDLVNILVELAQADRVVLRQLTSRFEVVTTPDNLVAATHQAIMEATAFDKRDINRNFGYDYAAYGEVKRNLVQLIALEKLEEAFELALDLMKRGSYQVEMSDEGLMTQDIEDCLNPVIDAAAECSLPAGEVLAWCSAMLKSDRVGFIAREHLEALNRRLQSSKAH